MDNIRGVDKVVDRFLKGREQALQKKLMTERGLPAQLMERIGKPEPTMNFYSDKSKFKSAFGVDGS